MDSMDVLGHPRYDGIDGPTARIKRHLDAALARFVKAPVVIESGEYGSQAVGHAVTRLPWYSSSMKNQEQRPDGGQITLRLDAAEVYHCYDDLMAAPFDADLLDLTNNSMSALEDSVLPMPKWPFLMLLLVSENYEFNTATSYITDPQTFVKGWSLLQRLASSGTATGDVVKRCLFGRTGADFLEKTGASSIPAQAGAMLRAPCNDTGALAPAVEAAVEAPRGPKALRLIKRSEPLSSPASASALAGHPRHS